MKIAIALSSLVLATTLQANTKVVTSTGSLEISEVTTSSTLKQTAPTTTPAPTLTDRVESTGKVIGVAKDVVALGEAIYALVEKGRPKVTTEYAPISILPRDASNPATDPATRNVVDAFDMEGFSFPVEKMITAKVKSPAGKESVVFQYKVVYSYGGSYNGAGKYLTGINIIPASVKVAHGWTFNSSMKLTGMMNHGTRANPVVGAMITIKYSMSSSTKAFERNDTIYITGDGSMKAMIAN